MERLRTGSRSRPAHRMAGSHTLAIVRKSSSASTSRNSGVPFLNPTRVYTVSTPTCKEDL